MGSNNNFIERSILGALSFLKESVFSDEISLKKGFLQSIDPRIKVISFVLFLISVLFIKCILLLLSLYLVCLLLAYISGINLGFFLKRTWVFIPLFSLFIAVPALFNTFTPGEPLFAFKILGLKLIISRQGLSQTTLFVLRVATSVSFVVLLGLVTRHNELLMVLRVFRVPQIFVMTFGICYRYIYLFAEIIENTYLAIKSRVGAVGQYKRGQRIVSWNIASLWRRSSQLNEEVYSAMLSRGYQGESYVLDEFKSNIRDWLWLFLAVIISLSVLYLDFKSKV